MMSTATQGQDAMAKPGPSDWGKINAGQPYGLLTVDMDRAFNWVVMGMWQRRLLQYIRENSWGVARRKKRGDASWPDPVPCSLNLASLAREWGTAHQRLYEARDWLVASKMVLEDSDGYWINKTGEEWVDPKSGDKLLAGSGLLHCKKVRLRGREDPGSRGNVHSRPSVNAEAGAFTSQREEEVGVHSRENVNANQVHSRPSVNAEAGAFTSQREDPSIQYTRKDPTGLIQDSTRCEEDRKTITPVAQTELKLAFPATEATTSQPCPPIPDEETSMYMIQTGGYRPDDATVQKLFRLAWSLFPGTEIANEYWSYQQWHSPEVWAAALRKGKQSKPGLDRINYILTIAAKYQSNGIPVARPQSFQPAPVQPKREIVATVAPAGYRDHILGKRSSESA